MAASRRAGQTGQIDFQGRGHAADDCGTYRLVRREGPNRWLVTWTAACDQPSHDSTLQFVSRDEYDRHF